MTLEQEKEKALELLDIAKKDLEERLAPVREAIKKVEDATTTEEVGDVVMKFIMGALTKHFSKAEKK